MGLFNYVHFEMDCPNCGSKITMFQTKDGICDMTKVEPDELCEFYTPCRVCDHWIDVSRPPKEPAPLRDKPLTLDEIKAMGFKVACMTRKEKFDPK